ncbi:hypothetical protein [Undibacterium squillarum]|uniref:hypothetical protein n=1 Tax=Undibacterium squillarum TaxID=1131567 RepID=UPI00167B87F0|nr:hypothetical protein [Undibacterium squillarum]
MSHPTPSLDALVASKPSAGVKTMIYAPNAVFSTATRRSSAESLAVRKMSMRILAQ